MNIKVVEYTNTRKTFIGPYTIIVIDHPDSDPYTELVVTSLEAGEGIHSEYENTLLSWIFYPKHYNGEYEDILDVVGSTEDLGNPLLKDWRNTINRIDVFDKIGKEFCQYVYRKDLSSMIESLIYTNQ